MVKIRAPFVWLSWLVLSCSAGSKPGGQVSRQDGSAGASAAGGSGLDLGKAGQPGLNTCDPTQADSACGANAPPPPNCGDGMLTSDEACDDGNLVSGDGCAANCLSVERGYSCNPPGAPCRQIARCGDGLVAASESCDDGNATDGDGCSARCRVELGFKCDGSPSACTHTICGDGKKEGAESCDDGNAVPFDGCSATCQAEPDCSAGACKSACGDGILINEECDDGNTKDGDGCSADCKLEPGFTCSQTANCEKVNGACVLRVPVVYHDFNLHMPSDFEVSCGAPVKGIAQTKLNAAGLPALVGTSNSAACIASADSFGEWYKDSPDSNTVVDSLVLFDNGSGGFVNRYGANGEQWQGYGSTVGEQWAANDYTTCTATGCLPCSYSKLSDSPRQGCTGATLAKYDGNPLFFPLDGNPKARMDSTSYASIPPAYGYANWPKDTDIVANAKPHDFSFTTHVEYWFQFQAGKSAALAFTGDDDVWVFINGTLAVDLGGLHVPLDGSVTVDDTTAASLGLKDGQVYKISVFHAERKQTGSSFRLTLAGFSSASSDCSPVCGDGIVSAGEQCDDGKNDGGYGECGPGCVLGAYCGDGIQQAGEDCDDGNLIDGDLCPNSCRILVVK
jgi:fibro-slime domain-containing protein